MTVCVYRDHTLAADSQVTLGNLAVQEDFIKVGKIYTDLVTNRKSLYKESLKYPVEYALYGFAGSLRQLPRFLRWFINTEHPFIDHDDPYVDDANPTIEEDFQAIVVFKEQDIVRIYDQEYEQDLYSEMNTDITTAIGSGLEVALGILAYDPEAELEKVIEAVKKVEIHCGGLTTSVTFDEILFYPDDVIEKAKEDLDKKDD